MLTGERTLLCMAPDVAAKMLEFRKSTPTHMADPISATTAHCKRIANVTVYLSLHTLQARRQRRRPRFLYQVNSKILLLKHNFLANSSIL